MRLKTITRSSSVVFGIHDRQPRDGLARHRGRHARTRCRRRAGRPPSGGSRAVSQPWRRNTRTDSSGSISSSSSGAARISSAPARVSASVLSTAAGNASVPWTASENQNGSPRARRVRWTRSRTGCTRRRRRAAPRGRTRAGGGRRGPAPGRGRASAHESNGENSHLCGSTMNESACSIPANLPRALGAHSAARRRRRRRAATARARGRRRRRRRGRRSARGWWCRRWRRRRTRRRRRRRAPRAARRR